LIVGKKKNNKITVRCSIAANKKNSRNGPDR
jgi:hypothetical protein